MIDCGLKWRQFEERGTEFRWRSVGRFSQDCLIERIECVLNGERLKRIASGNVEVLMCLD